jgi:hypothetical protein
MIFFATQGLGLSHRIGFDFGEAKSLNNIGNGYAMVI